MASLSFCMALFCKELNKLIEDNKFKIVYCKDYDYDCKSYFFTHLKEKINDDSDNEKQNKNRKIKKYLVSSIDYHNVNDSPTFDSLIDELNLLFEHSPKLKKGDLTTMIMILTKNGYGDLIRVNNMYKIETQFNDPKRLVDKEKDEFDDSKFNEKEHEIKKVKYIKNEDIKKLFVEFSKQCMRDFGDDELCEIDYTKQLQKFDFSIAFITESYPEFKKELLKFIKQCSGKSYSKQILNDVDIPPLWKKFLPQIKKIKKIDESDSDESEDDESEDESEDEKKDEKKDEFVNFIEDYFGENYDIKDTKKKFIESMHEHFDGDLKEVIPNAICEIIKVPDFMLGTDRMIERTQSLIRHHKDMIDELYNIVKKWKIKW